MADNTNDAFNGYMTTGDRLGNDVVQAYAKSTCADDYLKVLEAQLANAQGAVDFWKQRFWAVVEALGYDKADFDAGIITLANVVKYARACDTGDFV